MSLFEIMDMCFRNLLRRKVRTILTVIGVIIGTCAIVIMVSFGIALQTEWQETMESWGSLTKIEVYNYDYGGGTTSEKPTLDDELLSEWTSINGVVAVTPMKSCNVYVELKSGKNGRYKCDYTDIAGIYPEAAENMGMTLVEGRFWNNDSSTKKIPVLVGEQFAYTFMDSKRSGASAYVYAGMTDSNGQPVEPFVNLMEDSFTLYTPDMEKPLEWELEIIGVVKEDYAVDYRTCNGIYMRVQDIERIQKDYEKATKSKLSSSKGYSEVYVWTNSIEDVASVEQSIKDYGFEETYSMESERQSMEKQSMTIQMVLGGLGAVSLFVAAIGITNTMVMSIYERTKEIGIMKALGCYVKDIRRMFLFEAGAIGFSGGLIGLLLSYAISGLLNMLGSGGMSSMMGDGTAATKLSIIPIWLALLALFFSTMIGLIAGYAPARRAVKISALEAIRTN